MRNSSHIKKYVVPPIIEPLPSRDLQTTHLQNSGDHDGRTQTRPVDPEPELRR